MFNKCCLLDILHIILVNFCLRIHLCYAIMIVIATHQQFYSHINTYHAHRDQS